MTIENTSDALVAIATATQAVNKITNQQELALVLPTIENLMREINASADLIKNNYDVRNYLGRLLNVYEIKKSVLTMQHETVNPAMSSIKDTSFLAETDRFSKQAKAKQGFSFARLFCCGRPQVEDGEDKALLSGPLNSAK